MAGEPSNAASDFLRIVLAGFTERGSPPEKVVRAGLADDFVHEDRRRGPTFPDGGAESYTKVILSLWQTGAPGQPRWEHETLAVRGERFAAVAVQTVYGNGMRNEALQVIGFDATLSQFQLIVDFDIHDVEGAIAELDRLHRQAEAT
jgi:hypothetical protein